jgi:hypothetical protein
MRSADFPRQYKRTSIVPGARLVEAGEESRGIKVWLPRIVGRLRFETMPDGVWLSRDASAVREHETHFAVLSV